MSYGSIKIAPVSVMPLSAPMSSTRRQMTPSSFGEILNQSLQQRVVGGVNTTDFLSKDEIINLIREIRSHIDAQWIRTLLPDEEQNGQFAYLSPIMVRSVLPNTEASKNFQQNKNSDEFMERTDLNAVISYAAKTHGVDEALVRSVIKVESNFDPNSTSPKGAMGLMQLMPETARELGVQNAYDPVENVGAGTRYLKSLLNRYDGNVPLALAAYNWGMGNLERRPGQMPIETSRYVDLVTSHYNAFKA
jgi:soluble lytic murein transglycosylase-like protein